MHTPLNLQGKEGGTCTGSGDQFEEKKDQRSCRALVERGELPKEEGLTNGGRASKEIAGTEAKERRDGTEIRGDRRREGPRDHKRSGTEAQEPKGSKAGIESRKPNQRGNMDQDQGLAE